MTEPVFDVSGAVAVLDQTLEYAFPSMTIIGEVSEFRVSKGKWLYFDIKDEFSKLKCFGTIYQLTMPIESGMIVELIAQPRLHNLYGFSLNIQQIRPVGEGSIKKAADLLKTKLASEGLFAPERKRMVPYPPSTIALVTSAESAAYADFVKILQARWPHVEVALFDVQVQGMQAEQDIVAALKSINEQSMQPDVVVVIRGGGSADDLQAFSTETVTRAIAASRTPTLVAIGHEVDTSLAELAADVRASTPSNAAELLVPDAKDVLDSLGPKRTFLDRVVAEEFKSRHELLLNNQEALERGVQDFIQQARASLENVSLRIESYHPKQVLRRGYGIVRVHGKLLKKGEKLAPNDKIEIELEQQKIDATVNRAVRSDR
jgi:exodeoxyribonuclease VII large subunit